MAMERQTQQSASGNTVQPPALTLRQYQNTAFSTDQKPDSGVDLTFPLLGLFGETGSLLSEAKKKQRDSASYLGYAESVLEELGDVLWYLTDVATRSNLSISDMATKAVNGLRGDTEGTDMAFVDLQPKHLSLRSQPTIKFEKTLLHLASEVGLLVSGYSRGTSKHLSDVLFDRLVSVFHALIAAANEAGAPLEQAAQRNLTKILDRWPTNRNYPPLFDVDDLEDERLPR